MRLHRSILASCMAMMAIAVFSIMPASAFDRSDGLYAPPEFAFLITAPEVSAMTVALAEQRDDMLKPGAAEHDLAYTVQNQPLSTWRFAADHFSLIDPHILRV